MTVQDPTSLRINTNPRTVQQSVLATLRGLYTLSAGVITWGATFKVPLTAASATPAIRGVLQATQGGRAAGSDEDWHEVGATDEPAFQNSWANYALGDATAAFLKLTSGLVVIKGSIKSGANGTTAFTLPAGYRPALRLRFAGTGNVTPTGAILIEASGNVDIYFPGGPVLLVLNCSFMAEA